LVALGKGLTHPLHVMTIDISSQSRGESYPHVYKYECS